jgi:hypothetical protein
LLTALRQALVAKAKVHIQGDPLAIEKPRFVAERMAHLSIRRAAALQDSIRPMSQLGQTEKNSVRAYVFRFALELGHGSMQSALRICAISGSRTHSILVATGEHLAAMVNRVARLAAIRLRIARRPRRADKGPTRL